MQVLHIKLINNQEMFLAKRSLLSYNGIWLRSGSRYLAQFNWIKKKPLTLSIENRGFCYTKLISWNTKTLER